MIKKGSSKLPQIHATQRRASQDSIRSSGSRRSSLWDGAASNSDVGSGGEASDVGFLHADLSHEQARRVAEFHEGFLDRTPLGDDASWGQQTQDEVQEEVRRAVLDRRFQEVLQKVDQKVRERKSWIAEELVQEVRCMFSERRSWAEEEVLQELQRVFTEKRVWRAENVRHEVRRVVMDRKVQLTEELDDDILQRPRPGERDRASYYIVLPENGVPAVEALLSSRVRAELLNDEFTAEQSLQEPRRSLQDEGRTKQQTRPRNPWYLPPSAWYSRASLGSPSSDSRGGGHHDDIAAGGSEEDVADGEDSDHGGGGGREEDAAGGSREEGAAAGKKKPRALTRMEKETLPIVEAYRQSLKGHRLPHFLQ